MDASRSNPLPHAGVIAREQHRAITYEQLLSAGLSRTQITDAADAGVLSRLHTAVFLLGPPPSSPYERAHAAVLAGRPTGLMSFHWCRWLFDVGPLPDHDPDVTTTRKRRGKGITWHLTRQPPEPDANYGIPCTRPERMLIDLAPTLDHKDLRRLTNDVQIKRLTTAELIRRAIENHPGRSVTALRALVADDRGATRSLLEDLLDDLHQQDGLPLPLNNAIVCGYEVDFHFPDLRVILEADGYDSHWTRQQFHADRAKWLELEAKGERVIPISYEQVTTTRRPTAARLRRILIG